MNEWTKRLQVYGCVVLRCVAVYVYAIFGDVVVFCCRRSTQVAIEAVVFVVVFLPLRRGSRLCDRLDFFVCLFFCQRDSYRSCGRILMRFSTGAWIVYAGTGSLLRVIVILRGSSMLKTGIYPHADLRLESYLHHILTEFGLIRNRQYVIEFSLWSWLLSDPGYGGDPDRRITVFIPGVWRNCVLDSFGEKVYAISY